MVRPETLDRVQDELDRWRNSKLIKAERWQLLTLDEYRAQFDFEYKGDPIHKRVKDGFLDWIDELL